MIDRKGVEVTVGSSIKLIELDTDIWKDLPVAEADDLKSMIGETFEVYEISDGYAWIEKWWNDGEDLSHSHSLALRPNEIEVVTKL